jgi:hypothetical protein
MLEDFVRRPLLDDAAFLHYGDVVGDQANDCEIVADHQQGNAAGRANFLQQIEEIALDRHIQSGRRLVGGEDLRAEEQGAGDRRAPGLAATQLMRILIDHRARQTEPAQHLIQARSQGVPLLTQHFADLIHQLADATTRRERAGRVLKDRLDDPGLAAEIAPASLSRTVDGNAAGIDRLKPEDRAQHRGLPGAALADDAEAFARANRKTHRIDGLHAVEGHTDSGDLDRLAHRRRMHRASCDSADDTGYIRGRPWRHSGFATGQRGSKTQPGGKARRFGNSPLITSKRASIRPRGLTFGEWCPYSGNGELPDDQRADDGRSVVFETAPLESPLSFVGAPLIELEIEIADETALLAVRLQDVHPDGASLNVSYGLLNVAQREGADRPKPFPSGRRERVRLRLNDAAHVFPAGHRIRIALSNAFWPLAWPSPRHSAITLHTAGSRLTIPVLPANADLPKPQSFGPAIADDPEAVTVHASGGRTRQTIDDPASGEVAVHVHRSKSDYLVNASGTEVSHQGGEVFRVTRGRPNSTRIEGWGDWSLARGDWQVRTRSSLVLASTEWTFELSASMEAYEADELIMRRDFNFSIPRRLV